MRVEESRTGEPHAFLSVIKERETKKEILWKSGGARDCRWRKKGSNGHREECLNGRGKEKRWWQILPMLLSALELLFLPCFCFIKYW